MLGGKVAHDHRMRLQRLWRTVVVSRGPVRENDYLPALPEGDRAIHSERPECAHYSGRYSRIVEIRPKAETWDGRKVHYFFGAGVCRVRNLGDCRSSPEAALWPPGSDQFGMAQCDVHRAGRNIHGLHN